MNDYQKGGVKDLEEFLGRDLTTSQNVSQMRPLEVQGFMDSMEAMHFIIFLEKKYSVRLTREELKSISIYKDLIKIMGTK